MSSADTFQTRITDQAAAYGSLTATSLGRRERNHGSLRAIADITIASVVEPVEDLAVADRVAYVLAHRTNTTHVVIATAHTYLVVTTDQPLDAADAYNISQQPNQPRIISIATPGGVIPIIHPVAAAP